MKNRFLLFVSLCITVIFAACNQGGKTGLLVPRDAAMVFHLDLSSLSSKLSWSDIKQSAWFAEARKNAGDSLLKKLLDDPAASGINTESAVVVFMKKNANNGYLAIQGKLKDEQQFANMIRQSGKFNLQKDGEYSFATQNEERDAVLYFNNKMFVLISDVSDARKNISSSEPFTTGPKYSIDSLKWFAKTTFSLKGKDLLDSDKRFADLINDKADMHFWVNSGQLYGDMMGGMMSAMKISTLLKDNISSGTLNFENGKIAMQTKQFFNRELAAFFSKYSGDNVNDALLSKLPQQNVLAAFAMSYPPEGLKEFLKLLGVDGLANAYLGQLGFSVEDFIKANKGDIAFALTDLQVKATPATMKLDDGQVISYENQKQDMKFVFGVSVNDQKSFQKLMDVFGNKLKDQLPATGDSSIHSLKHQLTGNWFALGSNDTLVNAFLSGNQKPAYAQSFGGHNGGGYIDLQSIITSAATGNKDTAYQKAIGISSAFWKNISMHWDVKGGASQSVIDINLADAQGNALKQLNKYADQMHLAMPKKDAKNEDDPLVNLPPGGSLIE